MTTTLSQIVSAEKGTKARCYSAFTDLHKQTQKAEPFNALQRDYSKLAEDGEELPNERTKVRLFGEQVLASVNTILTEAFDIEATKDWANCNAHADVVVNGQVLIPNAPVTFLMYVGKQLTDIRTFVDKLPVLDEAEDWVKDPNSNLFKTAVVKTHRTKKVQKAIVLYHATEQHPAQTHLATEDVIAGYWHTTKLSGALPTPRKAAILARIDALILAVNFAREKANETVAPEQNVGAGLFGYLFAV